MNKQDPDLWSEWLQRRRFGGDDEQREATLAELKPIRDRVLAGASLKQKDVVLDAGCGDGLLGLAVLQQFPDCQVIFSDLSQSLLDEAQSQVEALGHRDRCRFVQARVEDLSALQDASVDVVLIRSVLMYVGDKQAAIREFYRVLRPYGQLSLFEPLVGFQSTASRAEFWGYDATPVLEIAHKVVREFQRSRPTVRDPMVDFDEYTLIRLAEQAGFDEIHVDTQAHVQPYREARCFETILATAPNPHSPTTEEAIRQALTPEEAREFLGFLRTAVEEKQARTRFAGVYLRALKF